MWRPGLFLVLAALLLAGCAGPGPSQPDDDLGVVPEFTLTERSGAAVQAADLRGHVWVAAFIFTRCAGPCTQVSGSMARLQHELADVPTLRLVSFTVDPEYDTPEILRRYADRFGADPGRWLFVTGPPEAVYSLIRTGFHLTAEQNTGEARTPGNEVMHDVRLVVVDAAGHIRGYYDATDAQAVNRLEEKVRRLAGGEPGRLSANLPAVNASLNASCAAFLLLGYAAIRRRAIGLHKLCMLVALADSALFLGCYLYYHLVVRHGEPTRFAGAGPLRTVYFSILISHTLLAAVVAPLAITVAYLGLRNRLASHTRLARWTLPLWLYVSVTGVIVYWMLYHLAPSPST